MTRNAGIIHLPDPGPWHPRIPTTRHRSPPHPGETLHCCSALAVANYNASPATAATSSPPHSSLQASHHQELGSCCVHSVRCPHPPGCPGDLVLVTRSPCPHLHCPHTTAWCTMCTVHSPVLYTVHTVHSSWLAAILGHWS